MAKSEGLAIAPATGVRSVAGRGVAARVDGRELRLGSTRFMQELNVDVAPLAGEAADWQARGCTVSWLAEVPAGASSDASGNAPAKPSLLGLLAFGDAPKTSAAAAVTALQKMGIRSALITGEAASRSGVPAKMMRNDESFGLLPTEARTGPGYRLYGDKEVHTLRFVRRARDVGFSMAEIAELLKLWLNRCCASADVKRIAQRHVADLERRMAAMAEMRDSLKQLAKCCQGDQRPDCAILEKLSGHEPFSSRAMLP